MKNIILFTTLLLMTSVTFAQQTTPNHYKSRVIKTAFFAPLFNHLEIGYEQALNNKSVLDVSLGIIGPGVSHSAFDGKSKGAYVKAGTKFFFNPDFVIDGQKRYNDFQGMYFEPQLIIGSFNTTYSYDPYYYGTTQSETYNTIDWSLNFNLGREFVLANCVSLNGYAGLGYGGTTGDVYCYSHVAAGNDFPITATCGLTIGILAK